MDVRFDHFIIEYYLAILRRKTTTMIQLNARGVNS